MKLIDAVELYNRMVNLEALALEQVGKLDPSESRWQIWSAIFTERSMFKFDLMDAPEIEAIPIAYMESQIDKGKWEEIIGRWRERGKEEWTKTDYCTQSERQE